jgi:hypothetical protein
MAAALLECGFLSNPNNAARLKDIKFLDGLANEIVWGLTQALGLKISGNEDKVRQLTDENRRLRKLIENIHWLTG